MTNQEDESGFDCGCSHPDHVYEPEISTWICQSCGNVNEEISTDFVHLRVHTHMSLLKGICKTEDLIPLSKAMGYEYLAKTDYDLLCGAPSFIKDCEAAGIKPIVGTNFEVLLDGGSFRITVIAKNSNGYKQLVRLNTKAHVEPLSKSKVGLHGQDILTARDVIILVPQEVPYNEFDAALIYLKKALSPVYIEIYKHLLKGDFASQEAIYLENSQVLSKKHNLPLVATNAVHYTLQSHATAHLVALQINKYNLDMHGSDQHYFKSKDEMAALALPQEAYDNSVHIANSIEPYNVVNNSFIIPNFKDEGGRNLSIAESAALLREEAHAGLIRKNLHENQVYVDRLEVELTMMESKKFSSYFLIIKEIVDFMVSKRLPKAAGRGSAGGSLVCYLLGITELDPIRWDLPFERFINEGRKDLPDIDTDISQDGRPSVLAHIAEKYGVNSTAQIATFQTLGVLAALDNVGRILNIPFSENRAIRKLIPHAAQTIDDIPADAKRQIAEWDGWLDNAEVLIDLAKNIGFHAAGVVISNDPLEDISPILPSNTGILGIQYDMADCGVLGLLKLDMLGVKTLDIIQDAFDRAGVTTNMHDLPYDDEPSMDLVGTGEYVSLFQLDSPGYRKLAKQLKPANFHHVAALNALYRPGPLESGATASYVNRRHGRELVESWHPLMDEVLAPTYGAIIYQEGAMAMSRILAGFSGTDADKFRAGIGKKNADVVNAQLAKFRAGVLANPKVDLPANWQPQNGQPRTKEVWVDELIGRLTGYARYLWNSSHSASYGRITYITAYLEAHYPLHYYAALLDRNTDKKERAADIIKNIQRKGVQIVPPHANESNNTYTVGSDNVLYMGLSAIKGVGKAAQAIIEERAANGKFTSFVEFCQRMPSVNKKAKENLVKAGAFRWDVSITDRDKLDNLSIICDFAKKRNKSFDGSKVPPLVILTQCALRGNEFDDIKRQQHEREVLNSYITGHPAAVYQRLANFIEVQSHQVVTPSMVEECVVGDLLLLFGMVDYVKHAITKRGDPYISFGISDLYTTYRIMVWSPQCNALEGILTEGQMFAIECTVATDKFDPSVYALRVKQVIPLMNGIPVFGLLINDANKAVDIVKSFGGEPSKLRKFGEKHLLEMGSVLMSPASIERVADEHDNGFKIILNTGNEHV